MDDLNLPGLFRNVFHEARAAGKASVTILVPQPMKDDYIKALSNTRMCQEQVPKIKIFPLPGSLTIEGVVISIEASENVEIGEVIL